MIAWREYLAVVVVLGVSLAVNGQQTWSSKQNPNQNMVYLQQQPEPQSLARPIQFPAYRETTQAPAAPVSNQGQAQFQYDAASFAITELARRVGAVLGQQSNAGVFSPVSIACALSLLLLGARNETRRELMQVLNFNPNEQDRNAIHRQYGRMLRQVASTTPDAQPIPWRQTDRCSDEDDDDYRQENEVTHLANAIFVQQGLPINAKFDELSRLFYNSSILSLDFANNPQKSAFNINRWASENTYGKINQIISDSINPDTQMIVANALYFKGLWKEMFEKQATSYKKFYPDGHGNPSTAKDVLTMAVIGCFPYFESAQHNARIVGLPYQGEKTALYIIIPNNSTRQRMQEFQRHLTAKDIGEMVVQMTVRKALVQIPKMKISNTINLRDILKKLQLQSIFSPSTSDLSAMLDNSVNPYARQRLFASEIIHKVELEINEKGTEGGAITASTIFRSLPSVQIRIDAPFLMMLGHDATRLPLFYGTIYDPSG
ncbi:serine protease inhibitor 28Dc-like [Ochlerotatus camptorhynchus]|uniref:serine protease inhibitor 28Dc-like n=1 Tax=Ochlerotatus camptorhynchus TaxID=644619 RepID=UPI0031E0A265